MKNTDVKNVQNGNRKQDKQNGVKAKPDAAQGLRELFVDELKDIYWAEKALTKAIPKMIKNATANDLTDALKGHLEVTKEHVTRLEKVFTSIGEKVAAVKCEAMAGLTKEAEEIMEGTEKGMVRDAGIISAAQKVEHYEIATYGTLCTFAKTLGETEAAALLHETLEQEKEADEKLTQIAESTINTGALHANEKM
jgi:ferritin-like metal-binding protein YciE